MSKKATTADIIKGLADVYARALNQTNLIHTVCEVVRSVFGTQVPDTESQNVIANGVVKAREWTGRTADNRKSEIKAVLKAHDVLDDMSKAVANDDRADSFTWHDGIKVARIVNRIRKAKEDVTEAAVLAAYFEAKPKAAKEPKTPAEEAHDALLAFLAVDTRAKHYKIMQGSLRDYCEQHGIALD